MKHLSKAFFALAIAAVSLFAGAGFNADAQVRSIPKRATSSLSNQATKGTQYDWLSTRYVTFNDIRFLTRWDVKILKNAIFARHGYIFANKDLRAHFNQFSWYRGTKKVVPEKDLNKYEKANVAFLAKYEGFEKTKIK